MPNSPYGNGPQDLGSQVPNQDMEQEILAMMKDSAPTGGQAMAQPQSQPDQGGSSIEQDVMAMMGMGEPSQPQQAMPEQSPQPEGGWIESIGNTIKNTQIFGENIGLRLKTGLAANETEALGYLKQRFGEQNAKVQNGKLMFKGPNDKAFKELDPDTFEIFGDLIADNGRMFAQEAYMLPGEIAGSIVGTGAAPGAGTFVGGMAGRMGMAAPSIDFADSIAHWAGIPEDPTRDKTTEKAVAVGLEAAAPVVGKVVGKLAKYVPFTRARKFAKAEKLERSVVNMTEESQAVKEAAEELQSVYGDKFRIKGEQIGYADADVTLMPHQLNPDHPVAKGNAEALRDNPVFVNAQNQIAQNTMDLVKSTAAKVAKFDTNKKLTTSVGEDLLDAAMTIKKAEGQAIGKFKLKAQGKLGNKPIPLNQDLTELFSNSRLKDFAQMDPNDLKGYLGTMGISDPGVMRSFINVVQDINESMSKSGGYTIEEIERLTNRIGDMNKQADKVGGVLNAEWKQLSAAFRRYRREAIGSALDEGDAKLFNATMDEYGALKSTVDNVVDTVSTDMGSHVVVKQMLGKGKEAVGDAKALKSMLGKSHPGTWERLKSEWMGQLLSDSKFNGTLKDANPMALIQKIKNTYGDEFMDVMFDNPKAKKEFMNSLLLAKRVRETNLTTKSMEYTDQAKQQMVRDGWQAFKWMRPDSVLRMFGIGKKSENNMLKEVLTQDGIEKYVTKLPPSQRSQAYQFYKGLYNYGMAAGYFKDIPRQTLRQPIRETRNRAAGAYMKEGIRDMGRENPPMEQP